MPYNPPVLELDLTGTNINNRISNEQHTLSNRPTRSLAANFGPFFSESLVVKDSGVDISRGVDYQIVELHQEATIKTGKEVSSVILIINSQVSNNVAISYQSIGGAYLYNDTAIANLYQSVITDDRPIEWNNVFDKPTEFVPTIHRHLLDDIFGFEPIVDYLERIKRAITLGQTSVVIEIVNSLISKFKTIELQRVLPSPKLIQYDAMLFFLSRKKILNNIWVDLTNEYWIKGKSYQFEIDTSGYPNNTTMYWEFYKPDGGIPLFDIKSGSFTTNGGLKRITVYVPSESYVTVDPIYIGIKQTISDLDYKAVTYRISIKENAEVDSDTAPIIIGKVFKNKTTTFGNNFESSNEVRCWQLFAGF